MERVTARNGVAWGLAALALAGGVAVYRRPCAVLNGASRLAVLGSGASEHTVVVDGLPVRYLEAGPRDEKPGGEANTIVLVHGLGGSAENWTLVLRGLSRGRRVLAVDLAGFGRTPQPAEGMRFSVLARYLARTLEALGVEHAAVAGNSLGGAVAIRYAAEHPEKVEHLFLLDSAGLLEGVPPVLEPEDRAAAQELWDATVGGKLPGFVLDDLLRETRNPSRMAYLHSDEPTDVRDDLPRIAAPTTIVWGENDRLIPPSHGAALRDAIASAELITLPDVGHVPQSQAPRRVVEIITERL